LPERRKGAERKNPGSTPGRGLFLLSFLRHGLGKARSRGQKLIRGVKVEGKGVRDEER